jgi:hypothetical protein
MAPLLNNQQLKNISNFKYSSCGITLLVPYLNKYWLWVVTKVPMTLAPNIVSLMGVASSLLAFFILIPFGGVDASQSVSIYLQIFFKLSLIFVFFKQAPQICYFLSAIFVWGFHTFDSIDGIQARRTNSVSPLGDLFDSGCDAISIGILNYFQLTFFWCQICALPNLNFISNLQTDLTGNFMEKNDFISVE